MASCETQAAVQAAIVFEAEYHTVNSRRPEDKPSGEPPVPTGAQSVPTQGPEWPDNNVRDGSKRHFHACILDGLRKTKNKPSTFF